MLRIFVVADNRLTGSIPPELGRLGDTVRWIEISGNDLTGCIPYELVRTPTNDFDMVNLPFCENVSAQVLVSCADGVAVVDAENNVGLVSDCETLLAVRDVLDPGGVLNWFVDLPIT